MHVCRCGGLLASAMVLLKQGDEQGGKMLLTKALKYAHNQLGNLQFVSQVLLSPTTADLARTLLLPVSGLHS